MSEKGNEMDYFAYGSNMDKDDLDKWCRKKGYTLIEYSNVVPAKLKDVKLAFNYFSKCRGGGVANIMKSKGNAVYGLLVGLKECDKHKIQRKEGCPTYYREIKVNVEIFKGEVIKDVITYKVVEEREQNRQVEPTKDYLQLIIQNAKKYDFPKDYIIFLESFKCSDNHLL